MRRLVIIAALLAALVAVTTAAASKRGPGQLGPDWTCFVPLPGDNVHCGRTADLALLPGIERMTFLVFQTSNPMAEEAPFLGKEVIIRADIFLAHHPKPCPKDPPSREFTYLGPLLGLDYYACHHYDSSF